MTQISPTQPTQAVPSDVVPWGFHAIMDCNNCDLAKITDKANIQSWLEALVVGAGFTAVGPPVIEITGTDVAQAGYTAVQLIVPSAITAHFVNDTRQIYIDIFSCVQFDPTAAEATIKTFFGADTSVKKILIPRNAAA